MFKSLSLYICTLKYSNRYLNFHKVWLHLKYGWKWDFLDPEIRTFHSQEKSGKLGVSLRDRNGEVGMFQSWKLDKLDEV